MLVLIILALMSTVERNKQLLECIHEPFMGLLLIQISYCQLTKKRDNAAAITKIIRLLDYCKKVFFTFSTQTK